MWLVRSASRCARSRDTSALPATNPQVRRVGPVSWHRCGEPFDGHRAGSAVAPPVIHKTPKIERENAETTRQGLKQGHRRRKQGGKLPAIDRSAPTVTVSAPAVGGG